MVKTAASANNRTENRVPDKLNDVALNRLFCTARTRNGWTKRAVTE
jgi:hypothetical protein